jgi:hypothetical protein
MSYSQTSELLYGFVRKRLFLLILVTPISLLKSGYIGLCFLVKEPDPSKNGDGKLRVRDASHDATKAPKIAEPPKFTC